MKKLITFLAIFLVLGIMPVTLLAQDASGPSADSYQIVGLSKIDGKYYASSNDTLYIWAKYETIEIPLANGENVKETIRIREIKVKFDSNPWEVYSGNTLRQNFQLENVNDPDKTLNGAATGTFTIAEEGPHTIFCQATDELGNEGPEVRVEVIIDNTAPFIDFRVENDELADPEEDYTLGYRNENGWFVGPNNKIFVYAYDLRAGVEKIEYFDIGTGEWVAIDPVNPTPIVLDTTNWSEGWNLIRARANDRVDNQTSEFALQVFLDVTGPEVWTRPVYGRLDDSAEDQDYPTFVTGVSNEFHVLASDDGSGLKAKSIFISERFAEHKDSNVLTEENMKSLDTDMWNNYSRPIKFFMTGNYYIYGRAVDNVGNPSYVVLIHIYTTTNPPTPSVRSGRADTGEVKEDVYTTTAPSGEEDAEDDEDNDDYDDDTN